MKLLLIGIDGGDERVFRAMDMPFVHGLLDRYAAVALEEDLWTRGWAKILSGHGGEETGAYYTKPDLSRPGYRATQRFRRGDYADNPAVTPLWEAVNALGYSIGLLNFPTTSPPPPDVNGWIVGGAGGGLSQKGIGGVPPAACSPPSAKAILDAVGYIWDIRFRASGITSLAELCTSLTEMQERRVDGFLGLAKAMPVDVGGLAFMATSRLQNIAMYEIERRIADTGYVSPALEVIEPVYRALDRQLRRLHEESGPEAFVLTADHGAVVKQGEVNLNAFLRTAGFQTGYSAPVRLARKVYNRFVHPRYTRMFRAGSEAFTHRYISGVYVNDAARFGGPVAEHDVRAVADRIVRAFDAYAPARQLGLSARPFRVHHADAAFRDLLPDVWVDRPDGMFFQGRGPWFVANPALRPLSDDLGAVRTDLYTGVKGRWPLTIYSEGIAPPPGDSADLTDVYRAVTEFVAGDLLAT